MTKKWKVILIISLLGNLLIVYVAYKALDYRSHVNYFLDRYLYEASGFSGRTVYEADNRRLTAGANHNRRVVFIGSQITSGWDLPHYFPHLEAINRGISGQRIGGYLLRFRPDVLELKPRAVVIEFSSYNFRPENSIKEIEDYIASLADLARFHGVTPLLTSVVPVRHDFDAKLEIPYNVPDSLRRFNSWLQDYCRAQEIKYVDLYAVLADSLGNLSPEFSTSQIQLSAAGYEAISPAVAAALKEIMPDSAL